MHRVMLFPALLSFTTSALAVDAGAARFGARFAIFNTTSWIREVNTTLIVPPAPRPAVNELALWHGLEVHGGGLTQSLLRSGSDNE